MIAALNESDYRVFYITPPEPMFFLDDGRETVSETGFTSKEEVADFVAEKTLGHKRNIAVGASSGGFPALRYAIENKFSGAIGFSIFSTFDGEMPQYDRRATGEVGREIFGRMHALEPDDSKRNISNFLDAHDYRGKIHLLYPEHNTGDVYQSENLSGHDTVTLLPQNAKEHSFFPEAGTNFRACWRKFERSL